MAAKKPLGEAWLVEIGQRIEEQRNRAGISRDRLAEAAGIHPNTLKTYTRKDHPAEAPIGTFASIARGLNVDPAWLLWGDNPEDHGSLSMVEQKLDALRELMEPLRQEEMVKGLLDELDRRARTRDRAAGEADTSASRRARRR